MGKPNLRCITTLCSIVGRFRRRALQSSPLSCLSLDHCVMQHPNIRTGFYMQNDANDQNLLFYNQNTRAFYDRFYSLQQDKNDNYKMARVNEDKFMDNDNLDSTFVSSEIAETSGSKRRCSESGNEHTNDDIREINPDGVLLGKKSKKHKKRKHSKSEKSEELLSSDNHDIICLGESDCVALEKTSLVTERKKTSKKHKKHKKHLKEVIALDMNNMDKESFDTGEIVVLDTSKSPEIKTKSDDKETDKVITNGHNSEDINSHKSKETSKIAKNRERRKSKKDKRKSASEDSECYIVNLAGESRNSHQSPSRSSRKNSKAPWKSDNKSKKNTLLKLDTTLDAPCDMDVANSPTVGGIHYVGDLEQDWQNNSNNPVTPSFTNVHFASNLEKQWQTNSSLPMVSQGLYSGYCQSSTVQGFQTSGTQSTDSHWQHQSTRGMIAYAARPNVPSSLDYSQMQGRAPQRGFHQTFNRWHHEWENTTSSPARSDGVTIDVMSQPYSGSDAWLRRRQWELTDYGKEKRSGKRKENSFDFSVASYNVLAQNLISDNPDLYNKCHPYHLDWEYRKQNLLHEISELSPDILCMQEVNGEHYVEFFAPQLKKIGYKGEFIKRTGDKHDGCATFWKESKFNLAKCVPVEYWKPGVSILDRDNVALLVLLKPKGKKMNNKSSKLCVANTHLLFNPRRGDVKLAQAMVLMAEIEKLTFMKNMPTNGKELYTPTIMCGDFNCQPFCDLHKFFGRGILEYNGLLQRTMSGQEEGYYGNNWRMGKQVIPPHLGISDKCQYLEEVKNRWMKFTDALENKNYQGTTNPIGSQVENADSETIDLTRNNDGGKQEEVIDITEDKASEKLSLKQGLEKIIEKHPSNNAADNVHKERCSVSPGKSPQNHDRKSDDIGNRCALLEKPSFAQCTGVLSHKANFVSVYKHEYHNGRQYEREATTHHGRANCTVDYIFYTVEQRRTRLDRYKFNYHSVKEGRLKLMAKLSLASERKLHQTGSLPNQAVSSDHTILVAKFALITSSK